MVRVAYQKVISGLLNKIVREGYRNPSAMIKSGNRHSGGRLEMTHIFIDINLDGHFHRTLSLVADAQTAAIFQCPAAGIIIARPAILT
jgi:hypothetical protein